MFGKGGGQVLVDLSGDVDDILAFVPCSPRDKCGFGNDVQDGRYGGELQSGSGFVVA